MAQGIDLIRTSEEARVDHWFMVPRGGGPAVDDSVNDHHLLGQRSMSKGFNKVPGSSRNVDTTTWQKDIQSSLQEKLPVRSGTFYNTRVEHSLGGVGFGEGKGFVNGCSFVRGARVKIDGIPEGVGNGGESQPVGMHVLL